MAIVEIDGSYGEGGGQVLRTTLTLAALTGQPVRVTRIRAGRRNPGLAPQHLTAVQATARICDAEVQDAKVGATELTFMPQSPPRPGEYLVDVMDAAQGGSAGAVTLILQTLLLPLAFAEAPSRITLKGGTHVSWSPSFDYLVNVFLPMVAQMGVRADGQLDAWGFYPVGNGQITVTIDSLSGGGLAPLTLDERGTLQHIRGRAVACNLPADIAQRIANRTSNVLRGERLAANITPRRERGVGPGAGVFLVAEYEQARAGFAALGARGKPSDKVADEACRDLLAHHANGAPVDMHLADQLLLPMALAQGRSVLRTCRVTQHLLTNMWTIRHFIPAHIAIDGPEGESATMTVEGIGFGMNGDAQP